MKELKIKIPYRQGILSYGSTQPNIFRIEDNIIRNNFNIKLSIAAGQNNYYFEIPSDTILGDCSEDGVVIAYINHSTAALAFTKIDATLAQIYVEEFPATPPPNMLVYNKNIPRGYIFSNSAGWCPKDFVVLLEVVGGVPSIVPTTSQIGVREYSTILFCYPPKIFQDQYVCSVQQGEVYVLEDYNAVAEDFDTTLIVDGCLVAENIDKYKPIAINADGHIELCTSNDDKFCIGICIESLIAGDTTNAYVSNGLVHNSSWHFNDNSNIYVDRLGNLTEIVNFNEMAFLKFIGTSVGRDIIRLDIRNSVQVHEN